MGPSVGTAVNLGAGRYYTMPCYSKQRMICPGHGSVPIVTPYSQCWVQEGYELHINDEKYTSGLSDAIQMKGGVYTITYKKAESA